MDTLIQKVLSGQLCSAAEYEDALSITETYVCSQGIEALGELWNDAEEACYSLDFPRVVSCLRMIWEHGE